MNNRTAKRHKYRRHQKGIALGRSQISLTEEEKMWLDVSPVGREFGSPDFERLARECAMSALFEAAVDVFSDSVAAENWFRQPNLALGDRRPLDVLTTDQGLADVRRILNAIATGGAV